jgi:hypothetical protein
MADKTILSKQDATTTTTETTVKVADTTVPATTVVDTKQPTTTEVVKPTDGVVSAEELTNAVNTTTANDTPTSTGAADKDILNSTELEKSLADKQTTTVVESVKEEVEVSEFTKSLEVLKKEGSASIKTLIDGFEKYISDMKPGTPMESDVGVLNQFYFWNIVHGTIEKTPREDFKKTWNLILGFFKEHEEGVFSDRYVFRFLEAWQWDTDSLTCYQRIVNLIKQTADPETRAVGVKQVDFGRTLEVLLTEEAKQKISSFYSK